MSLQNDSLRLLGSYFTSLDLAELNSILNVLQAEIAARESSDFNAVLLTQTKSLRLKALIERSPVDAFPTLS